MAAGGMNTSLNIAKALALGAAAVGMAGFPVYLLMKYGPGRLLRKIRRLENELRWIMLMAGAASLDELRQVPLVITGFTARWLEQRGINLAAYARRSAPGIVNKGARHHC